MTVSPSISLRCTLERHSKSIAALSIHPDGSLLVSGADDGLILIWSLDSGELIQEISCVYNGPVTAVRWIHMNDNSAKAFAFGCADGSIHVYAVGQDESKYRAVCFKRAHQGAIEDLAFEHTHKRLASVGHGSLQVWTVNDDYSIKELHPPTPKKPFIARNVLFCDRGEAVLVFYLESHEIVAYNLQPFGEKWTTEIPTRSGYSAFSADQRSLLISNLVNGIDSYVISGVSPGVPPTLQQTFRHPIRTNVPLQVTSALQGNWVISGSDDGSVRIFDQRSGEILKDLRHSEDGTLVQAVTSHSEGDSCLIVSGSTGPGPSYIKVWYHSGERLNDIGSNATLENRDHKWTTGQICVIVTLVSMLVNFAMPYVPQIVNFLYTWLLRKMIAWGNAKGIPIDVAQPTNSPN